MAERGQPVEQLRRNRQRSGPRSRERVELRGHEHLDRTAAQRHSPLRRDDDLHGHHRDHGRHPGAQLSDTNLPPYVLLGFTGGTGGFNDIHEVENVLITATGYPPAPPTVTGVPRRRTEPGRHVGHDHRYEPHRRHPDQLRAEQPGRHLHRHQPDDHHRHLADRQGHRRRDRHHPRGYERHQCGGSVHFHLRTACHHQREPELGPVTGGTTVTITGTGFTDAGAVDFGPSNVSTNWTIVNFSTIVATATVGRLGTYDIQCPTPGQQHPCRRGQVHLHHAAGAHHLGSEPRLGAEHGGTTVTITGAGLTGTSSVDFGGGNPSAVYTVNSDTSITATVPPARSAPST